MSKYLEELKDQEEIIIDNIMKLESAIDCFEDTLDRLRCAIIEEQDRIIKEQKHELCGDSYILGDF